MQLRPFYPLRLLAVAVVALTTVITTAACVPPARSTPVPSEPSAPWRAADPPPDVAGVRLGDSLAHVRAVLGTPDLDEPVAVNDADNMRGLTYRRLALTVITTPAQGVITIALLTPTAPQIGGIRVGDPISHLVQRWGPPHRRSGDRAAYRFGAWGVTVAIDTTSRPERILYMKIDWSDEETPSSRTPPRALTPRGSAPWSTTDPPPLVAGIRLGDSVTHVRSVLGPPTSHRRLVGGADELVYWPAGLAVVTTPDQGVAMIGLLTPDAPELAGVRVGDPITRLVQRWGPPSSRGRDRAAYRFGAWGVLVMTDTTSSPERILYVTLGWSSKKTPSSLTPPWPTPDTERIN